MLRTTGTAAAEGAGLARAFSKSQLEADVSFQTRTSGSGAQAVWASSRPQHLAVTAPMVADLLGVSAPAARAAVEALAARGILQPLELRTARPGRPAQWWDGRGARLRRRARDVLRALTALLDELDNPNVEELADDKTTKGRREAQS